MGAEELEMSWRIGERMSIADLIQFAGFQARGSRVRA
jgi:hypothetical protein